ncbi:MAG: Protease HtpX-like protein [Candidatus Levybacteria bacterium GW2011_GWC1_40_19]|nr:MAG: Protease HtpX-like protein [Candidatus Levybacteria bacterium GW2011_GWA1_39_32]KKR50853.1 MAG: Protease HtpX-like protein [Candidatus Levybacteria bacterium GW2011_GWC1_40_19]KKR73784.1 MAG: Protease HtpX-like protein [Candidatus Levybacteria bacterium GW2011_GWC2_40_7]KKR95244.1 MAG: Protease HtpX-like protein [Candidatus Levybacteria bacterium GW2011_GWA2_41_15]
MDIYSAISSNRWKTWSIMVLFVVFITTVVYVMSRAWGLDSLSLVGISFILAGLMSIGSFFYSDKLVLATSGAKAVEKKDFPRFYRIVENLSIGSGLPLPRIYVIDDPSPNAFATGRDPKHSVICATTGLLNILTDAELEGVIAHELSHIKNYDIRLMGVVAILVGFIAILSDLFIRINFFKNSDDNKGNAVFLVIALILAILSPIAATLIQLSVSRKREYLADASGVLLTRYPDGLASALEKLAHDKTAPRVASNATAHLFIENPFDNKRVKNLFTGLFNTHPPIEDRIKILRSM